MQLAPSVAKNASPSIAHQRIVRVRTSLILTNVFFGSLCYRLKLVETKRCPGGAMATDGKHVFFNPDWVSTVTDAELKGVFCHEISHCALGHPWRRGSRDPRGWNEACDLAVNPILLDSGFTLPKDALFDPAFKGMYAEQIYARRQKIGGFPKPKPKGGQPGPKGDQEENESGGDSDQDGDEEGSGKPNGGDSDQEGSGGGEEPQDGQWGEVIDASDDPMAAEKEAEWKVAVTQAANAAKLQGKLPGQLERLVEEVVRNKVDWKSALRRFCQQVRANDYSWRFPNRRYIADDIYLPSLRDEMLPPIVVVVDTSGSIGAREMDSFASEITSIFDECKPERVHVVYCDARVAHVQEFEPGDVIKLVPRGGGGTDFRPAFDWVKQQAIDPACMIYLTDTYGTFPDQEPEYPVVWAVTVKDRVCPFGETLYLGDDL